MSESTVQVPVSLIERVPHSIDCDYYCTRKADQPLPCSCARAELVALLSQLTPTAEPPAVVTGMRVRYIDGGDERIVGEFADGAWDLIIPGTEKSRMCVETEVFWQTVELVPEPPRIEDMAPGTIFTGKFIPGGERRTFQRTTGSWPVRTLGTRIGYHVEDIVPSTIRDVQPPKDAS